jgi:hypothetical protein
MDHVALPSVVAVFIPVTMPAALLPVRRAASADPMDAPSR